MRFGLGVGLTVFVGLTSAVSVSKREAGQGTEELVFKHITSPVSHTANVDACNGYSMSDVSTSDHGLTATLRLIGEPCNAYGNDIETLTLKVGYETEDRLHVTIADAEGKQYQVPEDVVQRPKHSRVEKEKAKLRFEFQEQPFSFRVLRVEDEEVLFDTQDSKLIFEDQYLHLATKVPEDANLYGLGQHNDAFKLATNNYTRTLWNRDAFGIPPGSNVYGSHPIYQEHRRSSSSGNYSTHGVALLNSHGMKVDIDDGKLSYNVLGGVLDLYFFAGPKPSRITEQLHEVVGLPVTPPYWGLGLHQCRYGSGDWIEIAQTIANYSEAGIPLETQWTDIDYMDRRAIFSTSPSLYPRQLLKQVIDVLHHNNQHYVVMVDPATAVRDYGAYDRGNDLDVFLKRHDGSGAVHQNVVWPGRAAYPDWFHPNATQWWVDEFKTFFNKDTGVDIDALWIDMNEPAGFLPYVEANPDRIAQEQDAPPRPPTTRASPYEVPGFPATSPKTKRAGGWAFVNEYPDDPTEASLDSQWLYPPFDIGATRKLLNGDGSINHDGVSSNLSDFTARTDLTHYGGVREYAVHNLYGLMMSKASREAMLARRPNKKALILTRSTFLGSGRYTSHWHGDNLSTWDHYRWAIRLMLGYSIYGMPMNGGDICGFGGNTTETLCARWAMAAILHPFYRNHNNIDGRPQEFYRWNLTTQAAKRAMDIRYRLLDAYFTAFHHAQTKGTPVVQPLFWNFGQDEETFGVETQYMAMDKILVSPVTDENSTSVHMYLPKDTQWYKFDSWTPVQGQGWTDVDNVDYDEVPMHLIGGSILPLRNESAMTTKAVRRKDFVIIVAPDDEGQAKGDLYIDDGESEEVGEQFTYVEMHFNGHRLVVQDDGHYDAVYPVKVDRILFLNQTKQRQVMGTGAAETYYDEESKVLTVTLQSELRPGTRIELQ